MAYQTVKSVKKALSILELLVEQSLDNKYLTLADISKTTGILPVTAHNLLRTLEECGYVRRSGHGRYEEGERCRLLFRSDGIYRHLREIAEPIIRHTVDEIGESVLLTAIRQGHRMELLRCQTSDDRLVNPEWGANAIFYTMRTTRAILAWFSKDQLDSFVKTNGLPSEDEWPECKETRKGLEKELHKIRHAGGCCDPHSGYFAMAVPVFTESHDVVASLGCYAPLSRTDKPRAAGIVSMLHGCSARIRENMAISLLQ